MKVDHESRNKLVAAIERYLAGEIAAFEFDDLCSRIRDETDDETVDEIAVRLWFFYDDLRDHKVNLGRSDWDYVQRLLLVLRSDGHIEVKTRRCYDGSHLLAMMAFFLALAVVWRFDIEWAWLPVIVSTGAVSMLITKYREWRHEPSPREIALDPFSSLAELRRVRRNVPDFVKRPHPPGIATPFRPRTTELLMEVQWRMLWVILSPLILLRQALPHQALSRTSVRLPT